jgi:hypothetical protein
MGKKKKERGLTSIVVEGANAAPEPPAGATAGAAVEAVAGATCAAGKECPGSGMSGAGDSKSNAEEMLAFCGVAAAAAGTGATGACGTGAGEMGAAPAPAPAPAAGAPAAGGTAGALSRKDFSGAGRAGGRGSCFLL